jgi:hypothetical protein
MHQLTNGARLAAVFDELALRQRRKTRARWEASPAALHTEVTTPNIGTSEVRGGGGRGPVVGRCNHFGSNSRRGTEAASVLYSLLETAKLNGVDPARYLAAAVRAARLGELLLPWQMKA